MPALALLPVGLVFGSFATAVAHRLPRGEPVTIDRSRCTSCGVTIAAYDNIPVLSWIVLRGRCRDCGAPISPHYPVTELAGAVLFTLTALAIGTGDPAELALGLALVTTMLIVTLTDLDRGLIPNRVLGGSAVVVVAIVAFAEPATLVERGVAAVGAGGFLLLAALLYPRGMGMGDVKLAALIGVYLGAAVAPAMLVALATGASVGVALILARGSAARKHRIPFGPFLALGAVVGLLAGAEILDWYLDNFVG